MPDLIRYLVRAAGRDANFLLNVGPRPDGTLDPESVERLEGIGEWLAKYGDIDLRHARRADRAAEVGRFDAHRRHGLPARSRPSKAGDDGWLTLSGTEGLDAGSSHCFRRRCRQSKSRTKSTTGCSRSSSARAPTPSTWCSRGQVAA